jgi:hypothetical protein
LLLAFQIHSAVSHDSLRPSRAGSAIGVPSTLSFATNPLHVTAWSTMRRLPLDVVLPTNGASSGTQEVSGEWFVCR